MPNLFHVLQIIFVFGLGTLAQLDCNGNVTVRNASDARAVRECEIIYGNLRLGQRLNESINLDGLREVRGSITHQVCLFGEGHDDCIIPEPPFEVTSSTLTSVDHISFRGFFGLGRLAFPNLTEVPSGMYLRDLHNLTELDIRSLESLGGLTLEAERLETLHLDGLRESGDIHISNAGDLDSVDSIFAGPVRGLSPNQTTRYVTIRSSAMRNVRSVTFGWAGRHKLLVYGRSDDDDDDFRVILGGPDTTTMFIESLEVVGAASIERGSNMENLTVSDYYHTAYYDYDYDIYEVVGGPETLSMPPFDDVANITIAGIPDLRSIEMPKQAENWSNLTFLIEDSRHINLSSRGADGEQIWHWPRQPMASFNACVTSTTQDFLDAFIESNASVVDAFRICDTYGQLDCAGFSDWSQGTDRIGVLQCSANSSSVVEDDDDDGGNGAAGLGLVWWSHVIAVVLTALAVM